MIKTEQDEIAIFIVKQLYKDLLIENNMPKIVVKYDKKKVIHHNRRTIYDLAMDCVLILRLYGSSISKISRFNFLSIQSDIAKLLMHLIPSAE